MNFQIHALAAETFLPLFALSDKALQECQMKRMVVEEKPGTPCRVSLADAEVGETVILLNYCHQPEASPYQSAHAIFVRENAKQARPNVNEVPEAIYCRLISVRAFDHDHMMINADITPGSQLAATLSTWFDDRSVAYIHLHNAKPGTMQSQAVSRPWSSERPIRS